MQACLYCGKVHVGQVHQKKGYDPGFKGYDTPKETERKPGFKIIKYFKCPVCKNEQLIGVIDAPKMEEKKNVLLLPELR